eukprot:7163718-Pyramimonas_sp.AAC.1
MNRSVWQHTRNHARAMKMLQPPYRVAALPNQGRAERSGKLIGVPQECDLEAAALRDVALNTSNL